MAVNFNLLAPQQGPQNLYEGFAQGQEQAAQNALAQQKMAQEQQMNALRREQTQLGMQQTRAEMAGAEEDRARKRRAERVGMYRERILRAATPEAAREIVRMQFADPEFGPMLAQAGTLEQSLAEVPDDPAAFERYRQQEAMGMAEWLKSQLPKTVGNAIYLPGENRFVTPPQKEAATRTPIAVLQNGKPVYVSPEQAVGQTPFTPATVKIMGGGAGGAAAPAEKPLTPAQSAKRRDQLGKEFKAAQNALQTTQDVLDSISFVKNEPGLSKATGFTGTLLPSFPEGAAASAETRLKNLEGKVTALGKAQAAATGAIGSIANQEWKILADQIAAIDRSKGTKPLLDQLQLVEMQAQGAMERIRDAYQRQFGEDFERFPQFADLPTPKSSFKPKAPAKAPAASGNLTPQEQAELEQLRQRFGRK